jgi:predicted phosphodiesterase
MNQNIYTGREIAIFTDSHGMLEPTEAALQDISRRGISEIYSLGDNIGVGPNPKEVMDLLNEYGVISISGNSEEYSNLGIEPFSSYFRTAKKQSFAWTISKLDERQIGEMKMLPHSIELLVGGQKLALCHFPNDVRFDFGMHGSTWSYQDSIRRYGHGYEQFLYTNSPEQKDEMAHILETYGKDSPMMRGYLSAEDDPLFAGKRVDFFDAVIFGHVHFKIYEQSDSTNFYSIRAVGMAYGKDPIDTSSYVILKEKADNKGFDLEEVLVQYDRDRLLYHILTSDSPDKTIERFAEVGRTI